MENAFEAMPQIDRAALKDKLLDTVLADDNYLFWRRHVAEFLGWPDADDADRDGDGWDTYCTKCKTHGYIGKKETHPKNREQCPHCGAKILPAGWKGYHKKQEYRFLYYHIQRGAGRDVWVRALHLAHVFGEVGNEGIDIMGEAARYHFTDGVCTKWKRYFASWAETKKATHETWKPSTYSQDYYDAYLELDVDLNGTCLEYAMLPEANTLNVTMIEYMALYAKYPRVVEALMKIGFANLIEDKLGGRASAVNRVINWSAGSFRDIFRGGMNRQELRLLAGEPAEKLRLYRLLRQGGAVRADEQSLKYLGQIDEDMYLKTICSFCGAAGHKGLRQYYERQSRKSRLSIRTVLHDHADYLGQLSQLQITDGDRMPDNLHEAHERLSMRIAAGKKAKENAAFRVRRRLLSWTRFAWGGFIVRPIDSETELIREGERQRNCVAGYAQRHKDGDTAILVLRRRDRPGDVFFTVEYNERTNSIRQCRAYRNQSAAPEVQTKVDAFCTRWLDYLQRTHFAVAMPLERRISA